MSKKNDKTQETLSINDVFRRFAAAISHAAGSAWAFMLAMFVILVWLITGPAARYSETWQLVINTATTIVTFLMVFLIQNTQNREALATQLKLDELIRAIKKARTEMVDLEELSDDELNKLQQEFQRLQKKAQKSHESTE